MRVSDSKILVRESFHKIWIAFVVVLLYQVKNVDLIPFLWLVNSVEHLFFFSKYDFIVDRNRVLKDWLSLQRLLYTETGE